MNYHPQSNSSSSQETEHFDVLIVGAGISGIGSAYHLGKHCPGKSYAILEGRENLGGTWDLFKYPGIRSDSDMSTLGYGFKPWTDEKVIADAPRILDYLRETIRENGIDQKIRYEHRVLRASWSSDESQWTLHVEQMYSTMLMRKAKSWFTGYNSNVEGHEEGRVRYFVYNGGGPKYVKRITEVQESTYDGITLSGLDASEAAE